jgi:two-component system nitrate/nitrite sensor histidine kinase NarX
VLNICILDNGRGFDLSDVPSAARHGVQIMRERADLLGASFELSSEWEKGTQVSVSMPIGELERNHD